MSIIGQDPGESETANVQTGDSHRRLELFRLLELVSLADPRAKHSLLDIVGVAYRARKLQLLLDRFQDLDAQTLELEALKALDDWTGKGADR